MSSPKDLSIEALAEWLDANDDCDEAPAYIAMARAVRALVEAKVREAIDAYIDALPSDYAPIPDDEPIVSRVMGGDA